jgi:AcrR family transcriptional regulator
MADEDIALETGAFRRGPGGRPTRQEAERRHRELLDTTKRLLLERGWEATSIDEISRQSGVAKRFLYARYPDKAALFFAAVAQFRDEQIGTLGALAEPPDDVEEGLLALGRQMLAVALRDETLAIVRLFLAEAPRMRGFAKLFAESFPRRGLAGISHFLAAYVERGALSVDDPQLASEHFAMLVVGMPQRLAMLGHRDAPEADERRLRSAVKLFLEGCRRRDA